MIFAIVLLGICQIAAIMGGIVLFKRVLDAKQAEIEYKLAAALKDFTDVQPDDQPSKLAILLDATGAVIGSAAARSLMASLKQVQSADAHVANGVADQLQADQNPILGLLTSGKRGKGAALMRLATLIGPMLTGAGNTKVNHGSRSGQGQFKL